jgi:predicted AAA+ superfamily ATPase
MPLDPDLIERLRRVLAAVEPMLPKPVAEIDWNRCIAANWRRHSLAGYLESTPNLDPQYIGPVESTYSISTIITRQ